MSAPAVARRADRIPPFEVMDVVRAARSRELADRTTPVCHLEVGQPSTPPPAAVLAAAHAALDLGAADGAALGYTDSLGLPALRGRIARWYDERHGIEVDPERIAVTTGASAGCVLAFLACFDPGDRVVVCEPGYPCYRHVLEALGVEVVGLPVGPEDRFQPTPAALDALGPVRGLVVASPSNPTGAVLRPEELDALREWARRAGARIVSDEIYHGITEDRPAPTAAGPDRHGALDAVVVQSASKYFCMTGWRLGWLVLPEELVRPVERLSQNLYLSAPTLSQQAAIAAFDATDELDLHVRRYARNRRVLVDALHAGGVTGLAPSEDAFYVWADVGHLGDAGELCRRWLDELAVAATPGGDFDPVRGHRWVRFSVAGSEPEVADAAGRLRTWLTAGAAADAGGSAR